MRSCDTGTRVVFIPTSSCTPVIYQGHLSTLRHIAVSNIQGVYARVMELGLGVVFMSTSSCTPVPRPTQHPWAHSYIYIKGVYAEFMELRLG